MGSEKFGKDGTGIQMEREGKNRIDPVGILSFLNPGFNIKNCFFFVLLKIESYDFIVRYAALDKISAHG